MQAVRIAAQQAQIDDFITQNLAHGYNTRLVDNGVMLSEWATTAYWYIAEGLCIEPQILFMDEATSALDTEAEKTAVNEAIQSLSGKKTPW